MTICFKITECKLKTKRKNYLKYGKLNNIIEGISYFEYN